jgi:hypothetical protein
MCAGAFWMGFSFLVGRWPMLLNRSGSARGSAVAGLGSPGVMRWHDQAGFVGQDDGLDAVAGVLIDIPPTPSTPPTPSSLHDIPAPPATD